MHTDRDGDESNVILVTGRIVTPNGRTRPVLWIGGTGNSLVDLSKKVETPSGPEPARSLRGLQLNNEGSGALNRDPNKDTIEKTIEKRT